MLWRWYSGFNDEFDEENRRYTAMNLLKTYIDENLSNEKVIVLGDLNDDISEPHQNNVFQDVLNDSDNYQFGDLIIAQGNSSDWSFPNWPSHLDHILITNELFDELDSIEVKQLKLMIILMEVGLSMTKTYLIIGQ